MLDVVHFANTNGAHCPGPVVLYHGRKERCFNRSICPSCKAKFRHIDLMGFYLRVQSSL
jgi:hypothetical protein